MFFHKIIVKITRSRDAKSSQAVDRNGPPYAHCHHALSTKKPAPENPVRAALAIHASLRILACLLSPVKGVCTRCVLIL